MLTKTSPFHNLKHTIFMEDDKLYIIYPLSFNEEQIQELLKDLKQILNPNNSNVFDLTKLKSIQLDTEDIALNLLFFFKELIESDKFKEAETILYFQPKVYHSILEKFENLTDVFNSPRIRKVTNE